MTNNSLPFKSGLLTPEEYRVRRDATTRDELDRLEEERTSWRIYFTRQHEFVWRQVMSYTVYILVIAWALKLTWHLYAGDSYGKGYAGKEVMYSAPIVHIDPASSQITYHKAGIAKDFGINISPVKMNDTNRQLDFQVRFPQLNSTVFEVESFANNFGGAMKQVIVQVLPEEAKLDRDLVTLKREGSRLDVVVVLPNRTDLSMLQRAYSSIQPGSVREAFIKSEEMQELVKDFAGQLVNLDDTHPAVAKKMMHISEGIQNANQMFMMSSNEFIREISTALERTQEELAKDHLLHTGLQKDVHHYRTELQVMQNKLHETERKLQLTEKKLNETKQHYSQQIQDLQDQNQAMKQQEKQLLQRIETLQQEASEQQQLKEELEVTVRSRQENINKLIGELESSKKQQLQSSDELVGTKKLIESLQMEKSVAEKNLERIQAAVVQVAQAAGLVLDKLDESQFGQIQDVVNKLNGQVIQLQSDLAESQKKISEQEEKLLNQSYQLTKSNATVIEQEKQIEQLEKQVFDFESRLSAITENKDQKEKLILELEKERNKLRKELDESLAEVKKINEQVKEQQVVMESYRGLIKQLKTFAGEIQTQYTSILSQEKNISVDTKKVEMMQQTINKIGDVKSKQETCSIKQEK